MNFSVADAIRGDNDFPLDPPLRAWYPHRTIERRLVMAAGWEGRRRYKRKKRQRNKKKK